MDDNGHGTHCAGIIAAVDNDIGVIGVAPEAFLYAYKVLDSSGSGYESDVIAAINQAVIDGIQIISMSLGSDGASSTLELACNNAQAAGVLLVAAAGNDYRGNKRIEWDTVDYPGRFDSVIAVGATDQYDEKASFSSTGPNVEIAAPGVSILSTYPGNRYVTASGTSMATPHVAGVAALIFASGVWSAAEVRNMMKTTADDLGASGTDYWYGYGLVDADEAASVSEPPEPDTTAPSQVNGLDATAVSDNQVDLTWIANSETDLDYYNVYRDGTPIATTTEISFSDTGLSELTTYEYSVSAVDSSGNEGDLSNVVSVTTLVTPPTPDFNAEIVEIVEQSRTAGKNEFSWATVTVSVTLNDNPIDGATVYGHWEGATSDTEIGTTDNIGIVVFTSDSVKNQPTATFTFVIDNVSLP
jgi:subtilisin family serine protease